MTGPSSYEQQCIAELRELIAHRTVNPGGDEVALCSYLAEKLRALGADDVTVTTVQRPEGSPGAYVYARFGNPTLLLNAHVDTVPANGGWTRDPLVAQVSEDRVYGLGSCDIKGAIAAILVALSASTPRDLGVLFSGDEERGSRCVPHFLAHTDTARIASAIICEPTGRRAGIRHRGVAAYRATYCGQGGHSSNADTMEKPLVELCKLAVRLDSLGAEYLDIGPEGVRGLCMNVAQLRGGVAYNVVPERCELSFSVRPPPGFDSKLFRETLDAVRSECHPKIEMETLTEHRPFECGDIHRARDLVGHHTEEFAGLDFWTEAAILQEAGIHSVVIGPGDIAQAHAANEFVLIEDLRWAVDLFMGVVSRHAS